MDNQNKYDALFSKLKSQIQMDSDKKQQSLSYLKATVHRDKDREPQKRSFKPIIISIASIVVAACLILLFINDVPTNIQSNPIENQQPNETNEPTPTEWSAENQIFDVENFGQAHVRLEQDILRLIQNMNPGNEDPSIFLNGVKVDGHGVAIINFTEAFVQTFPNVTASAAKGELMTALNENVFSYDEINTVYYLYDGNASKWFEWMESVHEPMTREMFEKVYHSFDTIFQVKDEKYYVFGVTVNDSKAKVIEMLGDNYTEEHGVVIEGEGPYDQINYKHLELNLFFRNDHLASAIVQIPFPHEFDEFFDAYQGDKLTYRNGRQINEEYHRIIYSEKNLQVMTVKYTQNKGYWLYLESVANEDIINLQNGKVD